MPEQWIYKIKSPLSPLERRVLAVIDGAHNSHEVARLTGIGSGHVNNIMTKLARRGLIEKVWRVKK